MKTKKIPYGFAFSTAKELYKYSNGDIDGTKLVKNTVANAAGVPGGYVGTSTGAAIGTAICPGIGTAIGAFLGGIFGSTATTKTVKSILD